MTSPYDKARAAFDQYAGMDGPDLPDDRDSAVQVQLCRWQVRNFGSQDSFRSLAGMTEEFGELADALIGMTHSQDKSGLMDALVSYVFMASALGRVAHATLKNSQGIRGVDNDKFRRDAADACADIDVYKTQFLTAIRVDAGTNYRETAAKVMQRDWNKARNTNEGELVETG